MSTPIDNDKLCPTCGCMVSNPCSTPMICILNPNSWAWQMFFTLHQLFYKIITKLSCF